MLASRLTKPSAGCSSVLGQRRRLTLHAYHSLQVVQDAGLKVWPFQVAKDLDEVDQAYKAFEGRAKSQVLQSHVRERGKLARRGQFEGGLEGTTHKVSSAEEARKIASGILGRKFTHHNHPTGLELSCNAVTLAPSFPSSPGSFEVDLLVRPDRSCGGPSLIARRRSVGLDPEGLPSLPFARATNPDEVVYEPISFSEGLGRAQALNVAAKLGLPVEGAGADRLTESLQTLYDDVFRARDATAVEATLRVNGDDPVITSASISLDPFASHRQAELHALRDRSQEHPSELEAEAEGMFYIKAPGDADAPRGNIGCFGYGAGLAMATMDALISRGGKPANFLDGGGGANAKNAAIGVGITLRDPEVKAVFINIFGGLTRNSLVAEGIINAVLKHQEQGLQVPPMVVRLRGTEADEGNELLRNSGLPFEAESNFGRAAQRAVDLAAAASS